MENYSVHRDNSLRADSHEAGMSKPIAVWCECLEGRASMTEALRLISKGVGAEIALLSRLLRDRDSEVGILASDLQAATGAPLPNQSFARWVMGPDFDDPEPGLLRFGSDVGGDLLPELAGYQKKHDLSDLAVISLGANDWAMDILELHFADTPKTEQRVRLKTAAATLASTWQARSAKILINALFRHRSNDSGSQDGEDILSMENPARLSRTEYRVCLLLSQGHSVSGVQAELEICTSTLRTHLRSIYAKTNASNLGELMYQLLSVPR